MLYKFQPPLALLKSIDQTAPDFVYNVCFQKEREASLIAMFGIGYQLLNKKACQVRLAEKIEPVEAQLKVKGKIAGFQISMAIEPGRRIGAEYKSGVAMKKYRPVDIKAFCDEVEKIITKKMKKYGSAKGVNLLIYGNMNHTGVTSQMLANRFENLKVDFDSIWLLMGTFKKIEGSLESGHAITQIFPGKCPGFFEYAVSEWEKPFSETDSEGVYE